MAENGVMRGVVGLQKKCRICGRAARLTVVGPGPGWPRMTQTRIAVAPAGAIKRAAQRADPPAEQERPNAPKV